MEMECPSCGHRFDTQVAPGLKDACPRCMAEFLVEGTGASDEGGPEPGERLPVEPGGTIRGMEVIEFIGRGGMGFVYKARQPSLDRIVALKILDPRLAESPAFTQRFNREAKALAALSHPNIVQVYDYGEESGRYFLVMEYIEGTSLRQVLMTQRLTPETALRYVPQICDALEYAHAQGVIHRDIKPENILIDTKGNLKIADFGLAKIAVPEGETAGEGTASGHVMGTPHYMAPEQFKGMAKVDHRADIFSLGVVFYEMLTGELPIGRFPTPSEQVRVDVRLDEVVLKALEREPERRYQQASQVKKDVARIGSSAFQTRRDRQPDDGERIMPRKWPVGLFVCACIVLLAAFLSWGSIEYALVLPDAFDLHGIHLPGEEGFNVKITGWRGALVVIGVELPNWLVVVAAFVIALLAVLKTTRVCEPPPWISMVLALYGILHAAGTLLVLAGTGGHIGIGVIVTLAAFVAALVLLTREHRAVARRWPMGLLMCCGLVVLAPSLPYSALPSVPHKQVRVTEQPLFRVAARQVEIGGWKGVLRLADSDPGLPNWYMTAAALGIALLALLEMIRPREPYRWISAFLAGYGVLHASVYVLGWGSDVHNVQSLLSVFVALVAFIGIFALLTRDALRESRRLKGNAS